MSQFAHIGARQPVSEPPLTQGSSQNPKSERALCTAWLHTAITFSPSPSTPGTPPPLIQMFTPARCLLFLQPLHGHPCICIRTHSCLLQVASHNRQNIFYPQYSSHMFINSILDVSFHFALLIYILSNVIWCIYLLYLQCIIYSLPPVFLPCPLNYATRTALTMSILCSFLLMNPKHLQKVIQYRCC